MPLKIKDMKKIALFANWARTFCADIDIKINNHYIIDGKNCFLLAEFFAQDLKAYIINPSSKEEKRFYTEIEYFMN